MAQSLPVDIVVPFDRALNAGCLELPPPACRAALPAPAAAAPAAETRARPTEKRAASKRKKKPAARRRKTATKPRPMPLAAPAVIALPHLPEPLVEGEPAIDLAAWSALAPPQAEPEPLPRSRAPAPYRSGGLIGALADWLGVRTQQLWRGISVFDRTATRRRMRFPARLSLRRPRQVDDELSKLKAENERLRLQLEALLALQTSAVERATIPQP